MNRSIAALSAVVRAPEFWTSLLPSASTPYRARSFTQETLADVRSSLRERGYFQVPSMFDPTELEHVRAAIDAVRRAGLPPLFVFAYEAPWSLYASLTELLSAVLGPDYRSLAAFWAWYVDPIAEGAGWPRHRDRLFRTVDGDGRPEVVTVWVALTDATLDNGCIHVVPRERDDDYDGELRRMDFRDEDVRALPAPAGSVLGWTHQLIHWGGRAVRTAAGPRVSVSAEFQRRSCEPFDEELERVPPPLERRLALIGAQLLKYRHMQPPSPALLELAHSLSGDRLR